LDSTTGNLTQIEWGSGIDTAKISGYTTNDAQTVAAGLSDENVAEFAKTIAKYLSTTSVSAENGKVTGLSDGYYLVVDEATLSGEDKAYSANLLEVLGNKTVTLKDSIPTVQKKVKDTNDTDGETTGWQDTADYDVNDVVPFQLTATLGNNVELYNAYQVMFVDTLSTGLTYNKGSVTVKIFDKDGKEVKDISNYCTVVNDGTSLKIYCADVKVLGAASGYKIVAEYNATLNENSVIGSTGNPNEVYLTYSNNPNVEYNGFKGIIDETEEDGSDVPKEPEAPGKDDDGNPRDQNGSGDIPTPSTGSGDDTPDDNGKTTTDKVIVFTYKVTINKVVNNEAGTGTEPKAGAAFTLYKKVKDATATDGYKYVEVGVYTADTTTSTFTFDRIDDGEYKLVETTAPSGYNKIEDVLFTVSATHTDSTLTLSELTGSTNTGSVALTFKSNVQDGSLTADVLNQPGSNLPSTGGMGTKLFYIFGGLLVLAASVLLITRRRMSND
jgi:LPXTG-motif cell wall-anchored protein/uncharacterized repeat protein (TIGR01451 family)